MINKAEIPLCTQDLISHLRQVFARPDPSFDTTIEDYRWAAAQEEIFKYMDQIAKPVKTGFNPDQLFNPNLHEDDGVVRWW